MVVRNQTEKKTLSKLGYHIVTLTYHLLSLLPIRFLYFMSDCLYLFLYYILRYRRKVVQNNLHNSFPDKTEKELKTIEKHFYRHLMDVFIEYLILFRLNDKKMNRQLEYKNLELIDKLYEEDKDIILVMGHYANWECIPHLSTKIKYTLCLVYKQQRNAYFDYFLYKLRSRYGALPVEMNDAFKLVHANKKKNIRTALVLVADQSPVETKYFTTFLNHAGTPVYEGTERIAKALDMSVVYVDITKKSRGHYKIKFVLLEENSKEAAKGEITEKHVRYLEKKIREKPEYWLWSHRRWKRMEADYKK